jgi:hypothetical protein
MHQIYSSFICSHNHQQEQPIKKPVMGPKKKGQVASFKIYSKQFLRAVGEEEFFYSQ